MMLSIQFPEDFECSRRFLTPQGQCHWHKPEANTGSSVCAQTGSAAARYCVGPYRLTDKGNKVALLFVLFHKRVCGPLAHSLFQPQPIAITSTHTKLEAAYRKADQSIERILQLFAA
jgi:hypothetical protein